IYRQVEQDLFQVPDVCGNIGELRLQVCRQGDVFTQGALEDTFDALDYRIQLEEVRLNDASTTKGEELTCEICGAIRSCQHLLEVASATVVIGQLGEQQLAVALDHTEQVVEVVRDASSQTSHRFHLLR